MTIASTQPRPASIPLVDLKAQYAAIKSEIDAAIATTIAQGAFINGPAVKHFEQAFAAYCGAQFGIGASSGTTALHLALCALGIGPCDEVIVPAHTFIATIEAVAQCGARVVLADVDPQTYTIDPESVKRCLSPRTRAIIPVHLYGQMADMEALREIVFCCDHEVVLLEDAAQAHGARRGDHLAGSSGRAACFSFFPGKNLGAFGDAGMVTTSDAELAQRLRSLADHGRQSKHQHDLIGFNYRLDTLQAAILNVKLRHLDIWTQCRRSRAEIYDEILGNVRGITTPRVAPDSTHVYHLYVIRTGQRDALRAHLSERGITTGVHYPVALHNQPALRRHGFDAAPLPVTERIVNEVLSLPLYPEMTDAQVEFVAETVREFARNT